MKALDLLHRAMRTV
jgi:hypothetical protein